MITRILYKLLYKLPVSFFPYVLEFTLKFDRYRSSRGKGIIIINTHDRSGGASKIAYQLSIYFRSSQQVNMLVKYKDRSEDWIHKIASNNEVLDVSLSNYLNDQEKKGGWLDFSKISLIHPINLNIVRNAKIIHLHNLHGGYFSYALLPFLSKTKSLIWTLHDEHIITGHCSFTMQCENWKTSCSVCNFLNVYPAIQNDNAGDLKRFKERWIKKSKITFVTPSLWLSKRLKEAYPFIKNVQIIHNGIDINLFSPCSKVKSRIEFNLPRDKFLVLFIAEYATENPFKGGETIRELITLNTNKDILFVTIGGGMSGDDSNFIQLPYIKNEKELASLYSACDLMLYPTNADNHPLVVMEAMACKLPVLAPKIGGIPEIITNGKDGWLVDAYSKSEVYLKILIGIYELKRDHYQAFYAFGEESRKKIEIHFTLEQMLVKYEDLYSKILD
jgi:protein O-GlcNAc transferase